MKIYAVTYLFAGDETPSAYYTVQSQKNLVNILLDEWIAGDLELCGTMKFLRDNGIEPPIEDEAVIEGEFEEEIIIAADAVRVLLVGEETTAAKYLSAVATSILVEEKEDVVIPDNIRVYLLNFLKSGAFGGYPAGLSQKDAEAWIAYPNHRIIVMDRLREWTSANVAVMDEDEMRDVLLDGLLLDSLMEALDSSST